MGAVGNQDTSKIHDGLARNRWGFIVVDRDRAARTRWELGLGRAGGGGGSQVYRFGRTPLLGHSYQVVGGTTCVRWRTCSGRWVTVFGSAPCGTNTCLWKDAVFPYVLQFRTRGSRLVVEDVGPAKLAPKRCKQGVVALPGSAYTLGSP